MFTAIIIGVVFLVLAAALGFVPYVTSLPFNLDVGISTAAGYWYTFTHTFWFLTPVWDVFTWYFLLFTPAMMLAKMVFGHRIRS